MIARETPSDGEPERSTAQAAGEERSEPIANDMGNGPSPLDPLLRHLAELQMLAGHYVRARADQIKARVRTLVFWAIAGLVGLIIAVAFLVMAVVLVLRGIATGLVLLGLQPWAADMLIGLVCIVAVGATLAFVPLSQKSAARRKSATTMSILEHATKRNSGTASTKPAAMVNEPANKSANREICIREADAAKAAIRRVIRETRESLGTAVDVRLWTKKKPWLAMGLAATCGLAAVVLFRRAMKPRATNGEAPPSNPSSAALGSPEPAHGGIGAALASSLFDLAKFGLETAITTNIRESRATHTSPGDHRSGATTQAAQL